MTDITKKVNRLIPTVQRSQVFTAVDANAGDVLMIEESLGRAANQVLVEASGTMAVRFNVYQKVFPTRDNFTDLLNTQHLPNLISSGHRIKDNTTAFISLSGNETFEIKQFPVTDIEVLTYNGLWTITVF